jgi:hypothetical protein
MTLNVTQANVNVSRDVGAVDQVYLLANTTPFPLPISVPASGNVNSGVITNCGYKNFTFALTSTQAGSVSIQRYVDQAGTIPVGAAITGSVTANTATDIHSTDSIPYQSMIITVNNSSGSIATLSNCALLLQAN